VCVGRPDRPPWRGSARVFTSGAARRYIILLADFFFRLFAFLPPFFFADFLAAFRFLAMSVTSFLKKILHEICALSKEFWRNYRAAVDFEAMQTIFESIS